ncbi:MAG: nitrogen fixation protein NifQ [Actinobacteria bacterium]|nr:nitrogen fixation protein NifQ [Actinomycetota bacterium]
MRHSDTADYLALMARVIEISGLEGRGDEYIDLVNLLLSNRAFENGETERLAHVVAFACLGENHLWQDMCLQSRLQLSDLLHTHFTPLARKNTYDMKWKKFFYKQLCELEGLNLCTAPSCGVCVDYGNCFGPED